MEMITNMQEARMKLEQYHAENNPALRKTMSVPEMRRLLGVKKTESYWLVHRNFFKTIMIDGKMRVDLESFEKWYANQVKHKKVNGEEPGAELKRESYSVLDAANLLGVNDSTVYEICKKEELDTFTVDYVKRIPKESFEKWYQSQDKYQKQEPLPTMAILEADYILLEEAADILKITREKMRLLAKSKKYKNLLETKVYNNKRWISRKGLQTFLNAQNEYRVKRKSSKECTGKEPVIETKEYISRDEAADLAGVAKSTITKWMQAGCFPCTGAGKVLRIRRIDFLKWLDRNRKGVK